MINAAKTQTYQSLRQTGKEFCGKLFKVIPRGVLVSTAQELGLWKSGILVGDEGDTDILADRMIYSLYFYRLHRRFGIDVQYGADDEEER